MAQIKILDQNMINMIAAGEVIERPASVVKELMENSIDAGATKITVAIEDGGRKLISVTDNGCGMDAEDLKKAFESHATSKIKSTSDLQNISTLGFRGEALASIASVAQVRAVSKTKDSLSGNCLEIDCGQKNDLAPSSADYGTTIEVRDLFYKLPARRKFLRTANTEAGHITEQFTRIALANENLNMTLIHNGRELYQVSSEKNLRSRISQLFPREIAENLIVCQSGEKGLEIFALMGKPQISRTNSKFQYVFLNGRFIHDKFISHAIKEAYRNSIEPNRFAVIFLFIKMPYKDYDVNVHPTKIEVRFYNANLVHSQILGALREKLLATNLDVEAKLPEPSGAGGQINDAIAEFFKSHCPATTQQRLDFTAPAAGTSKEKTRPVTADTWIPPQSKFIQLHDSFIVTETDDGFTIIDQHALHERIMYENLRKRISAGKLESQKLLIPQTFEVTDSQANSIESNGEIIEKLGIEVVPFGPKTLAIQSFPTLLAKAEPVEFVSELIDILSDKNVAGNGEKLLDEVLNMAACKAAIKAGQKLNDKEIEQLLADRDIIENSRRCPHGRPTAIKFSNAELEKQFKRT